MFLSELVVTLVEESNWKRAKWRLTYPLIWRSPGYCIIVPTGYETDFASVPRVFGTWLLFGGVANEAATLHDYLCDVKILTTKESNKLFYEAMLSTGIGKWKAWCMYQAVHLFGPKW